MENTTTRDIISKVSQIGKKRYLAVMGEKKLNTTAVVGLGYVGLPLALLIEQNGGKVIGIDIDQMKIDLLNKRKAPFHDKTVSQDLMEAKNFTPTSDHSYVSQVGTILICVPTPVTEDGHPDLQPLQAACLTIGKNLTPDTLVIVESTINPGTMESTVQKVLEKSSGLVAGKDFFLAHCPERINPGDELWSIGRIPRVVGGINPESTERAAKFYEKILPGTHIKRMGSVQEAEAVKMVENSFRDLNIAFVNELAVAFAKSDIDIVNVIDGAATKPFGFMAHYPGCGVGGHCIPVDPYYLIDFAQQHGADLKLLRTARQVNESMPQYVADLTQQALGRISPGSPAPTIAVLGLAYKPDIDDCRESPALKIVDLLKANGGSVITYDPYVPNLSTAVSLSDALNNASIIIIATAHRMFKLLLTPQRLKQSNIQTVIDGRNCLPKEAFAKYGIDYLGIGH